MAIFHRKGCGVSRGRIPCGLPDMAPRGLCGLLRPEKPELTPRGTAFPSETH